MTDEQKAAYVISQAAAAIIEAMGMAAENQQAVVEAGLLPHQRHDFQTLLGTYGIFHNSVIGLFHD